MQTDAPKQAEEEYFVAEHEPAAGSFDSLKARLDEIVELVSDESMPLEDALSLYEEAVGLGLKASSMLEADIALSNAALDSAEEQAQAQESAVSGEEILRDVQQSVNE